VIREKEDVVITQRKFLHVCPMTTKAMINELEAEVKFKGQSIIEFNFLIEVDRLV